MLQKVVAIVVILVIVLGGGMYAYQELMPTQTTMETQIVYATKEVKRGDIKVGVEVQGILDCSKGSAIRIPGERRYDGGSTSFTINEFLIEEGDEVKKDQVIIILDSTEIENKIEQKTTELDQKIAQLSDMTGVDEENVTSINISNGITVRAPIDGKIVELDASQGQEIELGHIIGRVVDDTKYIGKIKIAPADYESVSIGDELEVMFEEFDGFHKTKVIKLNPNPVPNTPESDSDEDFAQGFIHLGQVEGINPGLVQSGMKFTLGKVTGDTRRYFNYKGTVEGFFKEKKIINTIKAVVTDVHVLDMETVKKGDPIITMASDDIQDTIEEKLEEIRKINEEIDELTNI